MEKLETLSVWGSLFSRISRKTRSKPRLHRFTDNTVNVLRKQLVTSGIVILVTIFWNSEDFLLMDYKNKNVASTGEYNASILNRPKNPINETRKQKLKKDVVHLRDKVPVHENSIAVAFSQCWLRHVKPPTV